MLQLITDERHDTLGLTVPPALLARWSPPLRGSRQVSNEHRSNPLALMEAEMDIAKQIAPRIPSISEVLHDRVSHPGFDFAGHA